MNIYIVRVYDEEEGEGRDLMPKTFRLFTLFIFFSPSFSRLPTSVLSMCTTAAAVQGKVTFKRTLSQHSALLSKACSKTTPSPHRPHHRRRRIRFEDDTKAY